jgi:hypothetical protein
MTFYDLRRARKVIGCGGMKKGRANAAPSNCACSARRVNGSFHSH